MVTQAFLSHSSEDKPQVERLAEKLEAAGIQTWLDKWHLIPGDAWQPEIEKALQTCDTCLVIIGPHELGPWHHQEMQMALNRRVSDQQFRVIPVLLPKAERGKRGDVNFLANLTWVEFPHSIEDPVAFERLVCGIRRESMRRIRVVNKTACPYQGLRTFDINDAAYFFGREALTDWLVADVRRLIKSDREPRFLAIIGASGSGKSSVARAGLLYELENGAIEGSQQWARIIIDHPGADPIDTLASIGCQALGLPADDPNRRDEAFIKPITNDPAKCTLLHSQANTALAQQNKPYLLIFIDQFEEIFTACEDAIKRQRFIDLLLHAAGAKGGKVLVVITIRMDFLSKCVDHPQLSAVLSGSTELVGAMSDLELESAIADPAALTGVTVEPSLVKTLVKDVRKQPGSLPIMEHVLSELWQIKHDSIINDDDYTIGIGGIEGALARRANALLDQADGVAERKVILSLLTRLVHVSDTPETDTRARYRIAEKDYDRLKPFVDAHLLVTSTDGIPQNSNSGNHGSRIIEIAHEALIRDWPELREALMPKRAFQAWKQHIQPDIDRWVEATNSGKTQNRIPLLEGRELSQAGNWLKDPALDIEDELRSYIKASQTKARRRLTKMVSLAALFLVVIGVFMNTALQYSSLPVARDLWLARIGIYWFLAPEMVTIPPKDTCPHEACTFTMGDDHSGSNAEEPAHAVSFMRNFNMGKYEVTFDEYDVFVELVNREGGCPYDPSVQAGQRKTLSKPSDQGWGRGRHPVINVEYVDARCYAQWLSQKTKKNYHLPSEAQWEYAARGNQGKTTPYFWGGDSDTLAKKYAWYGEDYGTGSTHPVGQLKANDFGLHDTAGNVQEWTEDCWHEDYEDAPKTGEAWEDANDGWCEYRVPRGGSWRDGTNDLRSAKRGVSYSGSDPELGFRLAQD